MKDWIKIMDVFTISNDGKSVTIYAKKEFFNRECIFFVADKYSINYFVFITPFDEFTVKFCISHKDDIQIDEKVARNIMNDLIDYQVRIDLQERFGNLRNKIIDYAFSSIK